jgi:hypothetical protein
MASFLVTCPQCRSLIAKHTSCPDCSWSEARDGVDDDAAPGTDLARDFARREARHKRNYFVFMALMLATGFVGLLTAYMWWRLIFLGDVVAFLLIILLSIATSVLGISLKFSKKLFPVALHCPSCDARLDQLGSYGSNCPGCFARLK